MLRRSASTWLLLLCLDFAAGAPVWAAREAPPAEAETTMREIFQALRSVFPLSLDPQPFRAPENRARILAALRALSQHAGRLEAHGKDMHPSFEFVRRTLVTDAREAVERYEQGQYEGARFTLHQLTEDCFACHSKLPSQQQFDLGQQFIEDARLARLPLRDRARLQVVTRQFHAALETYEAIFRSTDLAPAEIYLMGAFEDYLKLAIRVSGEFDRAARALQQFQRRPDVPRFLAHYVKTWAAALRELEGFEVEGNELARARARIRDAQLQKLFPEDRHGLVEFVAASSLLHRYVAARPGEPSQATEAYYLLGVAESNISRASWISETEFFLETAIRSAPGSDWAQKAYAFLEEYVISGYAGSAGEHLPPSVRARLDELRRLLDDS